MFNYTKRELRDMIKERGFRIQWIQQRAGLSQTYLYQAGYPHPNHVARILELLGKGERK